MQAEGLEQPEAVRAATARYREDSDTMRQFVSLSVSCIERG